MKRAKTAARAKRVLIEAVERRVLMSAGQLDPSFGTGGTVVIGSPSGVPITSAIAVGIDGRQVVADTYGPSASAPVSQDTTIVTRYDLTGTPDPTFGVGGTITLPGELVNKVLIRPAGPIDIVGSKLQQLSVTGAVQSNFASGGITLTNTATSEVLQSNGALLVGDSGGVVTRYNLDGSVDTTFGTSGAVTVGTGPVAVALDSGGRLVAATPGTLDRFTTAGVLDSTFATGGTVTGPQGQAQTLAISANVVVGSDGQIYEAVASTTAGGSLGFSGNVALRVVSSTGTASGGLNLSSFGYGTVTGLAVQSDGTVLMLGTSTVSSGASDSKTVLSRFDAVTPSSTSLTLDTTFNGTGSISLDLATHVSAASYTTAIDDAADGLAIGPNGGEYFVETAIDPGFPVNSFVIARAEPDSSIPNGTASIEGRVFFDSNGDGIQQSGEPSLPLYGAFIDNNNDGVFDAGDVRAYSDASGNFFFYGLAPGTYHIVEAPPAGESHTDSAGDEYTVTLTAGSITSGINFGLADSTGTITGTIFNDTNGNAMQDPTEISLAGFGVYLDNNNDGVYDAGDVQSISDSTGAFHFDNLTPGTYHLRQTVPAGYTLSTPTTLPDNITVTDGSTTTVNFGEVNGLIKFTGTIIGTSGSFQSIGNTIAKAFDGSVTTFFDAPSGTGGYVGLDLGTAQVVKEVQYSPRPSYASRMVGGEFQGSNDPNFATGVVTVATITATPQYGVLTPLFFGNTTAYRYYRYVGSSGGFDNISELAFFG